MFDYLQLQGIFLLTSGSLALLVFLRAVRSSRKTQSIALRYIGYAALMLALDFYFEGVPLLFFNDNQLLVAIGITVLGPIFIHATLMYLFSVVIVTIRSSISINYRLIIIAVGVFAGALNLAHNRGMISYYSDGFINPGFNPIAEFITFFTTIVVVLAFAGAFFKEATSTKINPRAALIGAGAIAVGISSPVVYSSSNYLIFMALNCTTLIGMLLVVIGVYLPKKKKSSIQDNP